MKDRHVLFSITGLLAAYLLVHAVMALFGLYWARVAGLPLATFAALALSFTTLGGLSLASAIGFLRYRPWAVWVWSAASLAILVAVGIGVSTFGVNWSEYLFEIGSVLVSLPYVARLQWGTHAG
jgi:hypothetical protein